MYKSPQMELTEKDYEIDEDIIFNVRHEPKKSECCKEEFNMSYELSSILYRCWEDDLHSTDTIIGYWPEDDSEYKLKVPYQLRRKIIQMQNWLANKYFEIQRAQNVAKDLIQWFTS